MISEITVKVHSYCQCILTTAIDGLTGGVGGETHPNILAPFGNSAIFSYHSVNSAIVFRSVCGVEKSKLVSSFVVL